MSAEINTFYSVYTCLAEVIKFWRLSLFVRVTLRSSQWYWNGSGSSSFRSMSMIVESGMGMGLVEFRLRAVAREQVTHTSANPRPSGDIHRSYRTQTFLQA